MNQNTIDGVIALRDILEKIGAAPNQKSAHRIVRELPRVKRRLLHYLQLTFEITDDWENEMLQLRETDAEAATLLDDALTALQKNVEVFDFSSRIVNIAYGRYYAGQDRDPVIRLIFRTMRNTLISDQDLEDTLRISNAVMAAVVDMMESIVRDQAAPESVELGADFPNLARDAVKLTDELSRFYEDYQRATHESLGSDDDSTPQD